MSCEVMKLYNITDYYNICLQLYYYHVFTNIMFGVYDTIIMIYLAD